MSGECRLLYGAFGNGSLFKPSVRAIRKARKINSGKGSGGTLLSPLAVGIKLPLSASGGAVGRVSDHELTP
jgi:hypothetical protein